MTRQGPKAAPRPMEPAGAAFFSLVPTALGAEARPGGVVLVIESERPHARLTFHISAEAAGVWARGILRAEAEARRLEGEAAEAARAVGT